MKNFIQISEHIKIDIPKLIESRAVILANSGGGKSYAIRKIAEEAVDQIQIIIIDPEGEFASLREKYDFILAGKGADVLVEVRSATLLATKLLELGKSAVIDLYELHPSEKQRYVKLFCEALINCPKELYHPVIIILDEAHEYVPEGKPSEATWAVEALASKGRKRGFCLIPASQRIAKLSKNVSAECNNKLIGRASQDIDMKRAGDELGFSKEKLIQLRQLKPGEFFVFGPAISEEVIKIKIGEVKTEHAKVTYKSSIKVPPPSSVIKKILSELVNLPQEAEKEAKTITEYRTQIKELKTKITHFEQKIGKSEQKIVEKRVKVPVFPIAQIKRMEALLPKLNSAFNDFDKMNKAMQEAFRKIIENQKLQGTVNIYPNTSKYINFVPEVKTFPGITLTPKPVGAERIESPTEKTIGKCAQMIAAYCYKHGKANKTQIAVATGYSRNSGGFNNSLSELRSKGILMQDGDQYSVYADHCDMISEIAVDTSLEKWVSKLGACAKKIFDLMLRSNRTEILDKQLLADNTGYSVTSGGFNNSISELSALGLIERLSGGLIRINPEILNL